ncbi:MAG TPA: hypothetical protein VKQ73_15920 [Stellaceae bacterium]|nr:hypothetical protein [Stellaceae bacterium]
MTNPPSISGAAGWRRRAPGGRDRRESERAIAHWEEKQRELGGEATVAALDLGSIDSPQWANRFLIAADPVIERSLLLLYGGKFAELLELPERARTDLPIVRQLPARFAELFLRGCSEIRKAAAAVRLEGEVARDDGRIEQYRAGFVSVGVRPRALTWLAFGAFNSRVVEAAGAG